MVMKKEAPLGGIELEWDDSGNPTFGAGNQTITAAIGATVPIELHPADAYQVVSWSVNGTVVPGEKGTTFNFKREVAGTYTVTVVATKKGDATGELFTSKVTVILQ